MSLRARLALAAAIAAALAALAVAGFAYRVTDREMLNSVDQTLEDRLTEIRVLRRRGVLRQLVPPPRFGEAGGFAQIIQANGRIRLASQSEGGPVPPSRLAREVAAGERTETIESIEFDETRLRVLTARWTETSAIQLLRPLDEHDSVLADLRGLLLVAAIVAVVVAAGLGLVVARTTLRPVHRLTKAVEDVTATRDLTRRVEAEGDDELARLAAGFNQMLAALDESVGAQRRLVADASHELRTPITSLRTNIEVLGREDELDPAAREQLRRDIDGKLADLSALVGSVIDLARGDEPVERLEEVQLQDVVASAVEQAEFHHPNVRFESALEPAVVTGVPDRIGLAITNLLDNAAKWSPDGATVEVTLRDGEVAVRDRGPGVAPADAPFVFDRFWRSPSAAGKPGSGLGLAIVRQVAESHRGRAWLDPPTDGTGARFRVRFTPLS